MFNLNEIKIEDLSKEMQELALDFGMENVLALIKIRGGEQLYIQKRDCALKAVRDRHIKLEFTGFNTEQLARKYNLSASMVRLIVNDYKDDKQLSLFD